MLTSKRPRLVAQGIGLGGGKLRLMLEVTEGAVVAFAFVEMEIVAKISAELFLVSTRVGIENVRSVHRPCVSRSLAWPLCREEEAARQDAVRLCCNRYIAFSWKA